LTNDLKPREALAAQNSGALLVDVREKNEWDSGHMPGAVWIPMSEIPNRLSELPRGRDLIFTCRSGRRSGEIKRYLIEEHGYDRVHNLLGGILAWATDGLSVVK